jgi:hypothetical protein
LTIVRRTWNDTWLTCPVSVTLSIILQG